MRVCAVAPLRGAAPDCRCNMQRAIARRRSYAAANSVDLPATVYGPLLWTSPTQAANLHHVLSSDLTGCYHTCATAMVVCGKKERGVEFIITDVLDRERRVNRNLLDIDCQREEICDFLLLEIELWKAEEARFEGRRIRRRMQCQDKWSTSFASKL
jgi:hypothetical protein